MKRLIKGLLMAGTTTILLAGCGNAATTTSSIVKTTLAPKKPTVLTNQQYVDELNSMGVKSLLKIVGEYGTSVQSFDVTNQNDVQGLENVDSTGIPKYEGVVSQLKKMHVPKDYQHFNTVLESGLSEFATTMQDMNKYLKSPNDTSKLGTATKDYVTTVNDLTALSKLLPFDQLT